MAVAFASGGSAHGAAADTGWLRFGYFASGTNAVDVYLDGSLVSSNDVFEQVTPYTKVPAGPHTVVVRPVGAPPSAAPLTTVTATVTPGSAATVAAVTGQSGLTAEVFQDDLAAPPSGQAKLRIIAAIMSTPNLDVYAAPSSNPHQSPSVSTVNAGISLAASGKPVLFGDAPFGSATHYATVPSGVYDVEVRATAGGQLLLIGQNWPILAGTVATLVVLTGPAGPTLEVLRDAQGSTTTAMPAGGLKTGAGGMAGRQGRHRADWAALAAIVALGLTAVTVTRRRTIPIIRQAWSPFRRA
jgi:Domain of unknown function (DUF4397)